MAQEEADLDVMSLLQPRQGYLWKLGGGQEKGSKWNKRWCVPRAPCTPAKAHSSETLVRAASQVCAA